jgi:methyl-accepting chemotaxis protein
MHTSLSKAFIVRVLLILLLCQAVLFAWSYQQEREVLEQGLQQKLLVVSRLLVNAAAKGLTEFDVTYLGLLTDEMLKDPDFTGLLLFDDGGIPVVDRTKKGTATPVKYVVPVRQGEKEIGKLQIHYSTGRIEELLQKRVLAKLGIQAGILLVIALFIYAYFRSRVARRISAMHGVLDEMSAGNLACRVNEHGRDELSAVAAGVDLLGERLAQSVSRMTALSGNVAATSQELSVTFSQTTSALAHQHDATEEITRSITAATGNQTQISINARRLLDLSSGNATTVAQNLALSEGIAERIDSLHVGMNDAYETVLALDTSAKNVAGLATEASQAVEHAVASSAAIRWSFADIERLVGESTRLSEQTTQVITDKGVMAVAETQQSMEKIHDLSESLRLTIAKLGEGSKDIGKILSVITEITDKTKLLALNASIIAAQSGEHGRGFAVVANEMKLLSDRTAHSTAEIASILTNIHHDIADAVRETGEATQIVQEGSQVVTNAGQALQEILAVSQSSQEMIASIKQAAGAQQEQLAKVAGALDKLHNVNAAVSMAATTEEVSIRALGGTIGELRDAMEHVRNSTEQQVTSMHEMMRNIETATGRTSEIANAVHEVQQVNGAICASLRDVVEVGSQTVDAISAAAERLLTMREEVANLHSEMRQFKV